MDEILAIGHIQRKFNPTYAVHGLVLHVAPIGVQIAQAILANAGANQTIGGGDLTITNNFNVNGLTTLNGNVVISGTKTLTVGGATTHTGAVTNNGTTTLNALTTANAQVTMSQGLTSNVALAAIVTGDTAARFLLQNGGTLQWGPGGAVAQDTNFYRGGVGLLKTDNGLAIGTTLAVAGTSTFNGPITANANVTLAGVSGLVVGGITTLAGLATMNGGLQVNGATNIVGATTVTGNFVVTGDITQNGTHYTANTTTIDFSDRIIHLNDSTAANSPVPVLVSGFSVHRGNIAGVARNHAGVLWDEVNGRFVLSMVLADNTAVVANGECDLRVNNLVAVGSLTVTNSLTLGNSIIQSTAPVTIMNGGSFQSMGVAGLCISNNLGDLASIPANGLFVKGNVVTNGSVTSTVGTSSFVNVAASGTGSFAGNVTAATAPTAPGHLAPKSYVDAQIANPSGTSATYAAVTVLDDTTLGNDNADRVFIKAFEVETDTRSRGITYNGDNTINVITETDPTNGGATLRTTTFAYNADQSVASATIVGGGKTITQTYGYDVSGNMTSMTKTVV